MGEGRPGRRWAHLSVRQPGSGREALQLRPEDWRHNPCGQVSVWRKPMWGAGYGRQCLGVDEQCLQALSLRADRRTRGSRRPSSAGVAGRCVQLSSRECALRRPVHEQSVLPQLVHRFSRCGVSRCLILWTLGRLASGHSERLHSGGEASRIRPKGGRRENRDMTANTCTYSAGASVCRIHRIIVAAPWSDSVNPCEPGIIRPDVFEGEGVRS